MLPVGHNITETRRPQDWHTGTIVTRAGNFSRSSRTSRVTDSPWSRTIQGHGHSRVTDTPWPRTLLGLGHSRVSDTPGSRTLHSHGHSMVSDTPGSHSRVSDTPGVTLQGLGHSRVSDIPRLTKKTVNGNPLFHTLLLREKFLYI
jgi:hypothetical protein